MRNVILIDFSSVLYPIWHQESTNPDPNATSTKVVARIRALASGQPHVALACDKGPYFRKEISPAYKATRGEPIAELLHQGEVALDVLRVDGFPVWSVKGFEADDVLASGVAQALAFEDVTVQLVSGDKDILQLIQPRVTVRKLTDGSVWDDAAVFEKLGVHANQVGDFLSLCGDAADNVIGAKGVGPKKAAELLTKFGCLEDLFVALTEHGTLFTPALATNLREFEPRMAEVRSLIRLRTDVVVPFEDVFKERVPADVAVFEGGEMDDIDATMQPLFPQATPVDGPLPPMTSPATELIQREQANAQARAEAAAEAQSLKGPLPPPPAPVAPPASAVPAGGLAVREAPATDVPAPLDSRRWLEPRDMRQAAWLAEQMFKARLYNGYSTPQGCLATILAGAEIGLAANVSLRAIHIIDSRQAFSADLIRSLCLQSPACEYFRIVDRTPEKATWVTKRKGDPEVSLTFTIEEGRAAWTKDQKAWDASAWGKRPVNMVTKTASSQLARLVFPDVALGMYCHEELTAESEKIS